jgi:hypothetical protein
MSDLYFTLNGDIVIDGNSDLAVTSSSLQTDVQQAYVRLMTEPGDFYVYPNLGIDLSPLYGMPQRPSTGEFGKKIIREGLKREGLFKARNIKIDAVPTGPDKIRFDIHIYSDVDQPVVLSISQSLGV